MLPFLDEYLHTKNQRYWLHSIPRYWWPKNPAIWFDKNILAYNLWGRIFPDIGLHRKTEHCEVFHFRLLPVKRNDIILRKLKKTLFRTDFWPFLSILGQTRIFQGKSTQYFLFLDFYHCAPEFYHCFYLRKNYWIDSKKHW